MHSADVDADYSSLINSLEIQWLQLWIVTAEFTVGKPGPIDGNAWI